MRSYALLLANRGRLGLDRSSVAPSELIEGPHQLASSRGRVLDLCLFFPCLYYVRELKFCLMTSGWSWYIQKVCLTMFNRFGNVCS